MKGIDVSKWQGVIDFDAVSKSGIDFVIIRAGYGKETWQKDPYFERNYKNAVLAGLKVGAYWYSYAETIEVLGDDDLSLGAHRRRPGPLAVWDCHGWPPCSGSMTGNTNHTI